MNKKIVICLIFALVLAMIVPGCEGKKAPLTEIEETVKNVVVPEGGNVLFLTVYSGSGSACHFYAFEKKGDAWRELFDCEGYLGRSGVCYADRKKEGDGFTPSGMYSFGECFGIKDAPCEVANGYTKVTEDDYWDSDSTSPTYNQHVKGSEKGQAWLDAGNYEHLIKYEGVYDYAAMINYNVDPVVPGKGSAIFLHCMSQTRNYSAGCVALPTEKMAEALSYIDENTYILILKDIADVDKYEG